MSRIGKQPIPVPKNVEVKVSGTNVSVSGPKGSLNHEIISGVEVKVHDGAVDVMLPEGKEDMGNFHGLYRAIINNMVVGVVQGFERKLEMIGVGYRASVQGPLLDLQVGFSHPTKLPIPEGLQVKVDKNTVITISGIDKQKVGQFAATIRAIRPPEPYQGKGIRYSGEYVRKKAGKAAAKK
ncbi:50S ribosomal protein L6 [Chlamydiales bacterium STE3]|uniref:Large ribosomal subunit protein uL6 n=1 Tax=Chlamydiales bacterium STE3 TaxID=1910938 RepID=A0A1K0JNK8_9CHLA|nr:50S ribosomal protein L6 [Chlamydiales bacterium STE3]SDA08622.1 50S ribosomal protein L6 [Chlamydiales bacterium STE3]